MEVSGVEFFQVTAQTPAFGEDPYSGIQGEWQVSFLLI